MGREVVINGERIEFNSILALRKPEYSGDSAQCIAHERLKKGRRISFCKSGRRIYSLEEEIPLHETSGKGNLSKKLGTVRIIFYTHIKKDSEYLTEGHALITEVY